MTHVCNHCTVKLGMIICDCCMRGGGLYAIDRALRCLAKARTGIRIELVCGPLSSVE